MQKRSGVILILPDTPTSPGCIHLWVQNHNRDMARLGHRQLEASQPQSESGKQKITVLLLRKSRLGVCSEKKIVCLDSAYSKDGVGAE